MRLHSLRVEHWRGLDALQLEGLSEHINLVYGPNESGKTRLCEALRFAFFETYRGEAQYKRALQGWASAEAPRVEVVFERGGQRYRLEKRFLKGGYTLLEGEGKTLKNEDAEERLRLLVGTGNAKSSGLPPEEQGIWRFVWVEQGKSHVAPLELLNAEPRGRLETILSNEVGEVASGPAGHWLDERLKQEARLYWSETWREAGLLRDARNALEKAQEEEQRARQRKASAEADVEELRRLQEESLRLEESLRKAEAKVDSLEREDESLRRIGDELELLRAQRALKALKLQQAQSALHQRQALEAEIHALDGELEGERQGLEGLQRAMEVDLQRYEGLQARLEALDAERRLSLEQMQRVGRGREQLAERQRLEDLRVLLGSVEEIEQRLQRLETPAGEGNLERAQLEAWRKAEQQMQEAKLRIEAAAAHLQIRALRPLVIDGRAIEAEQHIEMPIAETRRFDIEGILQIRVSPGGGDVESWSKRLQAARELLESGLRALGLSSLAEAEARFTEAETRRRERDLLEEGLRARAPQGSAGLRLEVQRLEQGLAGGGEVRAEVDPEALRRRHEALEQECEAARAEASAARTSVEGQRLQIVRVQQALAAREETLGAKRRALAGLPSLVELQERAAEESGRAEQDDARLQALQARYREGGGEETSREAARWRREREGLREQQREAREKQAVLRERLQMRGQEGHHELWLESEATLHRARETFARLQRAALAVKTLSESLERERRASQERLLAPVQRLVEPYLRLLFPSASLAVDEGWKGVTLRSGNVREQVEALSYGAREQLSLVVRLALSELLAEGERLPFVIDDALVYSDEERRRAMLAALDRASERLQLLLFTCHRETYEGLGAQKRYELPPRRGG